MDYPKKKFSETTMGVFFLATPIFVFGLLGLVGLVWSVFSFIAWSPLNWSSEPCFWPAIRTLVVLGVGIAVCMANDQ